MTARAAPEPTSPQRATTNAVARERRYWVLAAVLLVQFIAVLSTTVVSTASPRIVDDLHGLDLYAWIFTGYMLASAVTVPTVGKLSDLYGRRPFYIGGLALFLAGSAISGLAQNMGELIAARVVSGAGGGAMMALSAATIGDIFSPLERGRWMGLMMGVFGLGSIVGPAVGGVLTDHLGWRWVFYINLPFGLIALGMLAALLPRMRLAGRPRIDWLGIVLLVAGLVPMLLAFTWAGVTYPWLSIQVTGGLALGVLVLVLFLIYETRAAEPILSPHLFENKVFRVAVIINFLVGMSLFGSLTFIPLYFQGVLGETAQNAGFVLAPLMVGFVLGSVAGGFLVSKTGRYKILAVVGMAVGAAGLWLMSRLDAGSPWSQAVAAMVVTGIGIGSVFPLMSVVVQSAFPYRMLGTANSARQFFNNLGAVVGIPVMATIVIETFQQEFPRRLPASAGRLAGMIGQAGSPGFFSGEGQSNLGARLTPLGPQVARQVLDALHQSLALGIQRAFVLSFVLGLLGLAAALFLPEIPLRSTVSDVEHEAQR